MIEIIVEKGDEDEQSTILARELLEEVKFVIDKFHLKNHTSDICQEKYNPYKTDCKCTRDFAGFFWVRRLLLFFGFTSYDGFEGFCGYKPIQTHLNPSPS